ncbi:MAG TPA: c-type cytochrome, partial [Pirellulaceae bacterium]|nr:c-type cytochrome [Pirellulaceae bacterium]
MAIVSQHVARGDAAKQIPALIQQLNKAEPRIAGTIITGLDKGWPKDAKVAFDAASEDALLALTGRLPPDMRAQLVALATRWGSSRLESYTREIANQLLAQVRDGKQTDAARVTAARQLVEFRPRDVDAVKEMLGLIGPRTSPELGQGLLEAAGLSESTGVGDVVLKALAGATPAVRPIGIRVLLRRPEWTRLLMDALDQGSVRLAELTLDQKQSLGAHPDKTLAERAKTMLARGGGLPNPDRQKVLDELMPLTRLTGDAAKGKEIFKKQCSKCHIHSGEGTKIGPELTGMAVHPKAELLTHIIDPSRSVEGNYRVYTVVTGDGLVLNGLLASETKTTLELFDAEGKRQVLQREDVEELVASPKSLMPEGF